MTLSHLSVRSSSPPVSHRDVLPRVPGDTGVTVSSDGLLILPKAIVAYRIKGISVLVPHGMTGRFIATSSRKATGEAEGLLKEILVSQVPAFQFVFPKGVIKLEGLVGTERRCYQCCYSEGCASTFQKILLFSNDYK